MGAQSGTCEMPACPGAGCFAEQPHLESQLVETPAPGKWKGRGSRKALSWMARQCGCLPGWLVRRGRSSPGDPRGGSEQLLKSPDREPAAGSSLPASAALGFKGTGGAYGSVSACVQLLWSRRHTPTITQKPRFFSADSLVHQGPSGAEDLNVKRDALLQVCHTHGHMHDCTALCTKTLVCARVDSQT